MAVIVRRGSFAYPAAAGSVQPSSRETMDRAVLTLQSRKDAWVAVPVSERATLLDRLIRGVVSVQERWVAAEVQAKRLDPKSPAVGEEWLLGPYPILRNLRLLRQSLRDMALYGRPRIPGAVSTRANGQVVATVFPQSAYDRLFYRDVTAEVWMEPEVTVADLPSTQAVAYYGGQRQGKVALVLGAGNVSSLGPAYLLYKLFVENQVVLFKANPLNAYLGPLMEEAFRSLIKPGYLRVVYGGAGEGAYLCEHPGVDEVQITGSDKSFDAIVFGPGSEGAARKAARQPLPRKRITAALGNVSPVIVVPGPWSAGDLAYQAEHLASMLANNAGFNCNATRVIIQHAAWDQRAALLRRIGDIFAQTPLRSAYYPGARDRYAAFLAAHPEARQFGQPSRDQLPWTLIPDVAPHNADDIAFTTEAFCGIFAETGLEAPSVVNYIDRAVAFCNETLWGTLNATILVHPASLKDPAVAEAIDRAIGTLRYGAIAVNDWAAVAYLLGEPPWGGFPGSDIYDIQSGIGWVHNTLMFSRIQKSVVRAPWRATPTPPYFVCQLGKRGKLFRRLCDFEAAPALTRLPGVLWAAFTG